tara:strand:+ start:1332 stop:2036 length:705 start_codon:yes stop_codon:yes gene_type:complete
MANSTTSLDWCVVRLGEDHNWWVTEVSDSVRWDVDGLSIVDPRQVDHLIDSVDPLRDYGFDEDLLDVAFITFRIDKDLGDGKVRLKRVKDSIFDADEKLFTLPDIVDDENGPYADLLDHLTRCRVKLLNDVIDFESPLTVDEVEDEIREDQNASLIEGKAVHSFDELTAIIDYTPAGFETDDDDDGKDSDEEDVGDTDLPDIDEEGEKSLKGDSSLKWDEDDEEEDDKKEESRD